MRGFDNKSNQFFSGENKQIEIDGLCWRKNIHNPTKPKWMNPSPIYSLSLHSQPSQTLDEFTRRILFPLIHSEVLQEILVQKVWLIKAQRELRIGIDIVNGLGKKILLELENIPLAEGSTITKFDISCVCREPEWGQGGHLPPLTPPKKVLHIFL